MCLIKTLCCNVGKNCTIQTAGGTFAGKIEGVNREMVRLNTSPPCPPSHQIGPCDDICSSRPRPPVVQRYCDVMLDKIEAVCF